MSRRRRFLAESLLAGALLPLLPLFGAQEDAVRGDRVLNRRLLAQQQPVFPRVYDSHPAFVGHDGRSGFMVWHSFMPGEERIVGRELGGRDGAAFVDVSQGAGTMTPAEIAATTDTLAVAWSVWRQDTWQLFGRRRDGGKWNAPQPLAAMDVHALSPAIEPVSGGEFALAWMQWTGGRFELWWAPWRAAGVDAPQRFSDPNTDAFRPRLVRGSAGEVWAVWDAYERGNSQVYARQLRPALGPLERVSNAEDRSLKPVVTHAADGTLLVAWIRATDVAGAAGIIDQVHTIQLARRTSSGWEPIRNEAGGDEVAWLTGGLLAQIEPKSVPTGGYMGRRRDPMFVRDGNAVWLVWERKASQTGSTSLITGELLGRKLTGAQLGPVVLLAAGAVDYHVAHDAVARDGAFNVLGSSLPRDGEREYAMMTVRFAEAKPAGTEPWTGWKRVALPAPEAEPKRHVVRDRAQEYRLFWMDSHVHSGLSADAEGEPDEILLYARDRGRLDTVVMQENDFYNCPLTDYEYQLGAFYARAFSRDGQFVALPGYEWTQRLPLDRELSARQPRFWNNTYPNHRTVIYPRAGGPLIRYTDAGNDIGKLYAVVARHGGVMHTQHPDFDFTGAPGEVAIEVTAGWGIYFLNPGRIHATLNKGFRAGFVGTSDSHRRNPGLGGGLTGIYATELSADAILDAYRARRVFATSGARIAVEARADGALMGREISAPGAVKLTLVVHGTRPIRRATLIRDGVDVKVFTAGGPGTSANFEYEATVTQPGTHWFYWRVEQEGVSQHYGGNVSTAFGNLAWTTPNWVTFQP